MPVLIDEVIAEITDGARSSECESIDQQIPSTTEETTLLQTLELIRQRLDRLKTD